MSVSAIGCGNLGIVEWGMRPDALSTACRGGRKREREREEEEAWEVVQST